MVNIDKGGPPLTPEARANLIARVKNLLLSPKAEWERIDAEAATVQGLYVGYVCILAAIPAIATLIGQQIFGAGVPGIITYRPSLVTSISGALIAYVLSLASVFIMALIIEFLAPQFGGQKDRLQAFKVSAYFPTAAWVAGVFNLLPMLSILAVLAGLYSLYLLYLGLPRLMRTPQEKALPYTAVVIVAAIIVYIVIGAVAGSIAAAGARIGNPAAAAITVGDAGRASGTVSVPGVGAVDLGRMEQAARQAEASQNVRPVESASLQSLLPASIGGLPRTETSASSGSVAGMGGAVASAVYSAGDRRISLSVTDTGGASGLLGMAAAFNVQSEQRSGTRYERTRNENGRMITESYDSAARSGQYAEVIGSRFAVAAEGSGVDMRVLQAAVRAVDARRLEGLSRG